MISPKPLYWLGSSLADLRHFPVSARIEAGTDLRLIQLGVEPRDWRPMPGIGRGVREIRVRVREGAFRVLFVVESASAVYVLHAFQKKSQKTSRNDLLLAQKRFRLIP